MTYLFGPYTLDPAAYRLLRNADVVQLSPKIIDLLLYLVARQPALVSKEDLFKALWPDVAVTDNALTQAVSELRDQIPPPDVIVHACSSGGTQAGILAGLALNGTAVRVIGISADDPVAEVTAAVRRTITGIGPLLGIDGEALAAACPIEVHVSV